MGGLEIQKTKDAGFCCWCFKTTCLKKRREGEERMSKTGPCALNTTIQVKTIMINCCYSHSVYKECT